MDVWTTIYRYQHTILAQVKYIKTVFIKLEIPLRLVIIIPPTIRLAANPQQIKGQKLIHVIVRLYRKTYINLLRRRLSTSCKKAKKVIGFTVDRVKLPTINKTTLKNVQIRSKKVSNMYKVTIKFCLFLHVTPCQ